MCIRDRLCVYSHEELKKLIKLRIADDTAKPTVHEGVIAMYRRTLTMLDDIIASGECYSISQLAIKENDLITCLLYTSRPACERYRSWQSYLSYPEESPSRFCKRECRAECRVREAPLHCAVWALSSSRCCL